MLLDKLFPTLRNVKPDDVEMAQMNRLGMRNHTQICSSVFNLQNHQRLERETEFLARYFLQHLRTLGQSYAFEVVLQLYNSPHSSAEKILQLVMDISGIVHRRNDPQLSIEEISEELCGTTGSLERSNDERTKQHLNQVVFAILGQITMLFEAFPETSSSEVFVIQDPGGRFSSREVPTTEAGRRLCGLLKRYGDVFPASALSQSQPGESTEINAKGGLTISRLTYDLLATTCGINIRWTASLGLHLHLNLEDNELFLFQCPTFCVLHCTKSTEDSVFNCILREYDQLLQKQHSDTPPSTITSRAFLVEMLHSYVVLFGDAPSRKLLKGLLKNAITRSGPGIDPLLTDLSKGRGIFIEGENFTGDGYDLKNFPILGSRLLELQKLYMKQDPNTLRQLLRDRRNSLESLNVKAVIIFGVLSLAFSLIQIIFGAAQLAYAIKQVNQGSS